MKKELLSGITPLPLEIVYPYQTAHQPLPSDQAWLLLAITYTISYADFVVNIIIFVYELYNAQGSIISFSSNLFSQAELPYLP